MKSQILSVEQISNWDMVVKHSTTATFFQTFDWICLWQKHFRGPANCLAVFDKEKLVGFLPFYLDEKIIDFLAVTPVLSYELVSDFGDAVISTGYEELVWKTILKELKKHYPSPKISFSFVREDSPSAEILKRYGGAKEEVDVAPYIDLPSSWEEYLSVLDRHNRHELRRKIRRLENEGALKVCHEGDPTDIDEFFRLMSLSKEQKYNFLSEPMRAFFKEVIVEFWHNKMLWLCFLKLEGINIAATVSFIYNNEVLLYNSGFDPKYAHLSPGFLLKAFVIKHSIEEGRSRFDFLRGGERYKYNLGAKERKLYRFTFT